MRTPLAVAAACATLLIASCSGSGNLTLTEQDWPELPDKATTTTASTKTTASTSEAASDDTWIDDQRNERGNLVMELGDEAGVTARSSNEPVATFSIDKVEIDPKCHEYGIAAEDGHTLLLHVRVATGDNKEVNSALPGLLNQFGFSELGSDGVTNPSEYGMCTDPEKGLPFQYGANQKYRGTIEIVVPEANGTLILDLPGGGGGWEWTYPTK